MRYWCTPLAALLALACAQAQTRYLGLGAELGRVAPGGDWSGRYGPVTTAGLRLEWAPTSRWTLGLRGEILFGDEVLIDPVAALRAPSGPVLGEDGFGEVGFAAVSLKARGFRLAGLAAYHVPLPLGRPGWQLTLAAGPAYLQHNVRIQQDPGLPTPQVDDTHAVGYDRRAGGLGALTEAGLRYSSPDLRYAVFLDGGYSLTAPRELRSEQFDLPGDGYVDGVDTALGVRVGFVLGLLRDRSAGTPADEIYY